ncbi:MAG: ferredoxin [Chitinivibrionales bacterium]
MKAYVDPNRCKTVGTCVQICPRMFRFATGNKKAYVTADEIPRKYREDVLRAARECPEHAIIITE